MIGHVEICYLGQTESAFRDQSHSPLAPKETIYHSLRGENCFCNSGFRYSIWPKHDPYLLEESRGSGVTAPCANYLGLPPPTCVLSRAQTSLGLVNRPLFVLSCVLGRRLFRYLSCCFRAFGLFCLLAECSAYLTQAACSSCIPLLFNSGKRKYLEENGHVVIRLALCLVICVDLASI